jgi:hypothetical protein
VASILETLQCVSHAVVAVYPGSSSRQGETISVASRGAIFLHPLGKPNIWITIALELHFEEYAAAQMHPSRLRVVAYSYRIGVGDSENQEIVTYHWKESEHDARVRSGPHLHIGSALLARDNRGALAHVHKKHVPTGIVSFSAVIRFLIEELGVEPLRPNWDEILANVLD